MVVIECNSVARLESQLKSRLQKASDECPHEIFAVGVSGGSLISLLARVLPLLETDWRKWRFFFCDERLVPIEDKESTRGEYERSLSSSLPISSEQWICVDVSLSKEIVAKDYEKRVRAVIGCRGLDVALLGVGDDGHTASLFPNNALNESCEEIATLVHNSPKFPPNRVTLTLPFLNKSSLALFVVTGESKADTLRAILAEGKPLPAGRVRAKSVVWLLDSASARLLPKHLINE